MSLGIEGYQQVNSRMTAGLVFLALEDGCHWTQLQFCSTFIPMSNPFDGLTMIQLHWLLCSIFGSPSCNQNTWFPYQESATSWVTSGGENLLQDTWLPLGYIVAVLYHPYPSLFAAPTLLPAVQAPTLSPAPQAPDLLTKNPQSSRGRKRANWWLYHF